MEIVKVNDGGNSAEVETGMEMRIVEGSLQRMVGKGGCLAK